MSSFALVALSSLSFVVLVSLSLLVVLVVLLEDCLEEDGEVDGEEKVEDDQEIEDREVEDDEVVRDRLCEVYRRDHRILVQVDAFSFKGTLVQLEGLVNLFSTLVTRCCISNRSNRSVEFIVRDLDFLVLLVVEVIVEVVLDLVR